MSTTLTREAIREQLNAFLLGKLSARRLAGWAFDCFCDQEEEALVYEPGFEGVIGEVLDQLVWVDSKPFMIEPAAAQALLERLAGPVTEGKNV